MNQDTARRGRNRFYSAVKPHHNKTVAAVAASQQAVVTKGQLRRAGLSEDEIRGLVVSGAWRSRRRATYRVEAAPWTWVQLVAEACLAANAIAFRRTAARLYQLSGCRDERVELLVPHTRQVRQSGLVVCRTRYLPQHHVTVVEGLPATTVPRTLAELGSKATALQVECALEDALRRRLASLEEIVQCVHELKTRGRRGPDVLWAILERRGLVEPVGSDHELLMEKVLLHPAMPMPVRQFPVDTRDGVKFIDFAYPDVRLGVEYDGSHHMTPLERLADHARERALSVVGWQLIRFGYAELRRPRRARDDVRGAIAARGPHRIP